MIDGHDRMSSARQRQFTLSVFMLLLIPLSALLAFIAAVGIPIFLVAAVFGLMSGAGTYFVSSPAAAFTPPDLPLSRRGLSLASRRRYQRFRVACGGAVGILVTVVIAAYLAWV